MKTQAHFTFPMATLMMALAFAVPAYADEDEQTRARQAMLSGNVAPLSELLQIVEAEYDGEVLKVELEDEDARKWGRESEADFFIYEIKVLTPTGKLVKLKYDAKSLELLKAEGDDDNDENDKKHKND